MSTIDTFEWFGIVDEGGHPITDALGRPHIYRLEQRARSMLDPSERVVPVEVKYNSTNGRKR